MTHVWEGRPKVKKSAGSSRLNPFDILRQRSKGPPVSLRRSVYNFTSLCLSAERKFSWNNVFFWKLHFVAINGSVFRLILIFGVHLCFFSHYIKFVLRVRVPSYAAGRDRSKIIFNKINRPALGGTYSISGHRCGLLCRKSTMVSTSPSSFASFRCVNKQEGRERRDGGYGWKTTLFISRPQNNFEAHFHFVCQSHNHFFRVEAAMWA